MLIRFIFFISIFLISFYLTYHQIYTIQSDGTIVINSTNFASDTQQHLELLKKFFQNQAYIPHPLWHILVKITSITFHISVEYASVVVSSFLLLIWYILIYYSVKIFLDKTFTNISDIKKETLFLFISLSIFTIGPFVFFPYSHLIYKGVGSPNIWHNVTLWTVKPFALLSMLFAIWGLQKQKISYYIYALIATVLSIFAKPSFILIFLPSILLLSIDRKYLKKSHKYFLLSLTLISVFILSYQYLHNYGDNSSSKIIIDILGVWSLSSQNIFVSILLAIAFPLAFYILYPKSIKNDFILLSWLQLLFGIILYALFAQTGSHYGHGNFGWSYRIALSMLYLFSIIEFSKEFFRLNIWKKIVLSTILIYQVFIGIYYLIHILMGQNPIYIGIFL